LVQLTKILSTVLKQFYSLRASSNQDTADLYTRALPLLQELEAWRSTLPPSLQMGCQTVRRLCPNGYLHLSCYSIEISILRRIIRSTALEPLCCDAGILAHSRQMAHSTAQAAMSFVAALRPDHLEAFWYFTSPFIFSLIGSFITLLLVTSRSEPEKTHWRDGLNRYLWNLRVMSKGSEPMRYAVNRLEGAILKGMEHALAVNLNEPLGTPSDTYMALNNGEGFDAFDNLSNLDLNAFDWLSGLG